MRLKQLSSTSHQGREGGREEGWTKEGYYILNCVPLLINTGTPMVLPETDQDETDDEQERTHIGNIKENSGLTLCISLKKRVREEQREQKILYFELCFPSY